MLARVLSAVIVLVLGAACGSASPAEPVARSLPVGVWGTARAVLTVEADAARLELDCAHGTLDGPIALDDMGRFDQAGLYVVERPGPIVVGQPPDSHPARFAGTLRGTSLTLTVAPTDGSTGPGTFQLTRGDAGQLVKCR